MTRMSAAVTKAIAKHDEAVVEHLTELAVAFLVVAQGIDMRLTEQAQWIQLRNKHYAKVSGLVIAIAVIRGVTPAEVEAEIESAANK